MAPSKLRQAVGAAKDRATIALARAGGAEDEVAADVEVAIVRATAHGESLPADDRHVAEILALTRYSRERVAACVASVSRRLERTRAWPVAVKALALVHRLLAEGDPAFEQEVFLATRRGRRVLDMSRFRDRGRARSRDWDFAAFVHAYAVYLDDRLKRRMQGRQGGVASPRNWSIDDGSLFFHDTDGRNEVHEAWELVPGENPAAATEASTEDLIAKAQQLKHILGRFIDCRPTGKARTNRVVTAALYRLVTESAAAYCELTEVMVVLMGRFAELDTPACVRVHSIFTSLAKLVDELDDFYAWCKATAVCRPSDVPEVQRVRQKNLDLMYEFIRDRKASASRRSRSPSYTPLEKYDVVRAIDEPAPREQQVTAREENNAGKAAPAEPAGSLVMVDDKMADFLNLDEGTSPPSGEEHGRDLTLALFDGNPAEAAPEWVAFDDPSEDWETALVQSTRWPARRRAELGGGFDTAALNGMYSHAAAANATVTNARLFAAGSASSVAMQPLGGTVLALPPPSGANTTAAAARADPFAASLAVPPPTYVQMTDLQARQRLLVQEQNAWQQYERQRAPWSSNLL
ncbi:hypothetical protein SEVIR_5G408400v4 [Setaria viridis]|uniref:ENTH domain-containing protein n=2 Tax=Setaria viridis TaxID=4556 RepID=A0A4U6UNL3_SETVI|nr:hypothetical protein SEVIR_5G408400v2 [Setaria viridis]